ncbi:hypothetical protein [Actinoplanes sp. NPDC089786]|uniref:hypothetical protein n=1 Tax=Actinoplanes sp. NPDC089786 TaxID=3155185 RepID=UPI003441E975
MAKFARLLPFGRLQTPIRAFVHPVTGRTVTVVATNHFGTTRYYRELLTAITDRQQRGATVFSEGADMVPGDQVGATADEQSALDSMRRANNQMAEVFAGFGWVPESDVIGFPAEWRYVDLSHEAVIRHGGAATFQHLADTATGPAVDPRLVAGRFLFAAAIGLRVIGLLPAGMQAQLRNDTDTVILDQRNKLVLDEIDTTDGDVVTRWGARHLPGLAAGLTERGFQHTGRDSWHTVGTLPPIPTALWQLRAAHRAVTHDAKAAVR